MNGQFNSIDTDYGIGTILANFETDYIIHVVEDSLNMKYRPFESPMPNMIDVYERNFLAIKQNSDGVYQDNIDEVRRDTYIEIINIICNYYNLTFTGDFDNMTTDNIYGIGRVLYEIFISRFTDNFINFIVTYIIKNADSIIKYLENDPDSIKPKESGIYDTKRYSDQRFIMIHANTNKVVYNMAGYDIKLDDLIHFFVDPSISDYINSLLVDNEDIYKNHYASLILNPLYSAGILTRVKLNLQSANITINDGDLKTKENIIDETPPSIDEMTLGISLESSYNDDDDEDDENDYDDE
jgi:hypothetical protein